MPGFVRWKINFPRVKTRLERRERERERESVKWKFRPKNSGCEISLLREGGGESKLIRNEIHLVDSSPRSDYDLSRLEWNIHGVVIRGISDLMGHIPDDRWRGF